MLPKPSRGKTLTTIFAASHWPSCSMVFRSSLLRSLQRWSHSRSCACVYSCLTFRVVRFPRLNIFLHGWTEPPPFRDPNRRWAKDRRSTESTFKNVKHPARCGYVYVLWILRQFLFPERRLECQSFGLAWTFCGLCVIFDVPEVTWNVCPLPTFY